jgi:hypothetical protein
MTQPTYKLLQRRDGTYQLILIDAYGIEHPQPTLIEQADDAQEVEG